MTNLFVYGTLQAEEVVKALIGRVPAMRSGFLKGYRRYGLEGFNFPGTVPSVADDEVRGQDAEVAVFDEFEGDEYYKQRVQVHLQDGSSAEADVYLWQDSGRHLLNGSWDYDAWRVAHLNEYVAMCQSLDFILTEAQDSQGLPHGTSPT